MCEESYTRANLDNLIKELLGITEIPFQIKRQIREFTTERGYSFKGIARALCYIMDVQKFDLRAGYETYGIGLVKNHYNQAQTYFEKLRIEKAKQEEIQNAMIAASKQEQVVIKCGTGNNNKRKTRKQIDISNL